MSEKTESGKALKFTSKEIYSFFGFFFFFSNLILNANKCLKHCYLMFYYLQCRSTQLKHTWNLKNTRL